MRHAGQRRCRKCAMPDSGGVGNAPCRTAEVQEMRHAGQQRCVDSGLYLIRQALQGHGIRYICNLDYRKREVDKK